MVFLGHTHFLKCVFDSARYASQLDPQSFLSLFKPVPGVQSHLLRMQPSNQSGGREGGKEEGREGGMEGKMEKEREREREREISLLHVLLRHPSGSVLQSRSQRPSCPCHHYSSTGLSCLSPLEPTLPVPLVVFLLVMTIVIRIGNRYQGLQ